MRALLCLLMLALAPSLYAQDVGITWADNATDETGYRIERKLAGGVFAEIATTGPDVTSYVDAGPLTVGTEYCWRVVTVMAASECVPDFHICAEIRDPPPPPASDLTLDIIFAPEVPTSAAPPLPPPPEDSP